MSSFDILQGEIVGLIGRNGAGKSTLLKVLSRITKPTTGHVKLRARIGSLLEVGTGFHPELTGRENIFLNGAILGMAKREITHKFDQIVTFAGEKNSLIHLLNIIQAAGTCFLGRLAVAIIRARSRKSLTGSRRRRSYNPSNTRSTHSTPTPEPGE